MAIETGPLTLLMNHECALVKPKTAKKNSKGGEERMTIGLLTSESPDASRAWLGRNVKPPYGRPKLACGRKSHVLVMPGVSTQWLEWMDNSIDDRKSATVVAQGESTTILCDGAITHIRRKTCSPARPPGTESEPYLGRITGSASVDTLVRVGLEKQHGLSGESRMTVLDDFAACAHDELSVTSGQVVYMLYTEHEWMYVLLEDGKEGFIPRSFVKPCRSPALGKRVPPTPLSQVTGIVPLLGGGSDDEGNDGDQSSSPTNSSSHLAVFPEDDVTQPASPGSDVIQPASPGSDVFHPASPGSDVIQRVSVGSDAIQPASPGSDDLQLDSLPSQRSGDVTADADLPDVLPFGKRDHGKWVAMYAHDVVLESDVKVTSGEVLTLLNADDNNWLWVRRSSGAEGFVPRNYVCKLPDDFRVRDNGAAVLAQKAGKGHHQRSVSMTDKLMSLPAYLRPTTPHTPHLSQPRTPTLPQHHTPPHPQPQGPPSGTYNVTRAELAHHWSHASEPAVTDPALRQRPHSALGHPATSWSDQRNQAPVDLATSLSGQYNLNKASGGVRSAELSPSTGQLSTAASISHRPPPSPGASTFQSKPQASANHAVSSAIQALYSTNRAPSNITPANRNPSSANHASSNITPVSRNLSSANHAPSNVTPAHSSLHSSPPAGQGPPLPYTTHDVNPSLRSPSRALPPPFPASPTSPYPVIPSSPYPGSPTSSYPVTPTSSYPASPTSSYPANPTSSYPASPTSSYPVSPSSPYPVTPTLSYPGTTTSSYPVTRTSPYPVRHLPPPHPARPTHHAHEPPARNSPSSLSVRPLSLLRGQPPSPSGPHSPQSLTTHNGVRHDKLVSGDVAVKGPQQGGRRPPLMHQHSAPEPHIQRSLPDSHSSARGDNRRSSSHENFTPKHQGFLGHGLSLQPLGADVGHHGSSSMSQAPASQPTDDVTELVTVHRFSGRGADDISVCSEEVVYCDVKRQPEPGWLWVFSPRLQQYGYIPRDNVIASPTATAPPNEARV